MARKEDKEPKSFANVSEFVPVQALIPEVRPGEGSLVVMRDATFRLLIRTGAVNFDAKSPGERAGIIHAFGELVDSLDPQTPIEIVQHSKRLDTDAYSRQFQPIINSNRLPPRLKELAAAHLRHFDDVRTQMNLLQRELYVVLSSKGAAQPVTEKVRDTMPGMYLLRSMGKGAQRRAKWRTPSSQEITTARADLSLQGEEMEARLQQIGVTTHRLDEKGLRDLLNELFNPQRAERQRVGHDRTPRLQLQPAQRRQPRAELEPPRFA
jgi:hypothetical protein